MRVKNITFSGFAVAVLITGVANAADEPAKIASQAYVDRIVGSVTTNLSDNYTKTADLPGVITTELGKTDSELKSAIGTTVAGQVADDLAKKEDAINKVTAINDGNKESEVVFPTTGAVVGYINGVKATAINSTNKNSVVTFPTTKAVADYVDAAVAEGIEVEVNTDMIDDGAVSGDKIADGAVTELKIADKSVTEAKLSDDLQGKISSIPSESDINTQIESYAIPKPSEGCKAKSGRCVLSVDDKGDLTWIDVTAPLGE